MSLRGQEAEIEILRILVGKVITLVAKENGEIFYNQYIPQTLDLLRQSNLIEDNEGVQRDKSNLTYNLFPCLTRAALLVENDKFLRSAKRTRRTIYTSGYGDKIHAMVASGGVSIPRMQGKSEETILATNATSTFRTYATRKRKYSKTLEAKYK
nr:hypothetical protein [Tanacetum cinerariifolium]